jgi:hypothetical protein
MAWTVITTDLVRSALNNTELTAAQTVAQQAGQTDPITNWIAWGTNFVRAYAKRQVTLEAAGVPPALVSVAMAIIVYKLLQRIAPALAKERKEDYDQAMEVLNKLGTSEGMDISEDTALPGTPTILENERTITPGTADGI